MKAMMVIGALAVTVWAGSCGPELMMSASLDGTIYVCAEGRLVRVDKGLDGAVVLGEGFEAAEVSGDGARLVCVVEGKVAGVEEGQAVVVCDRDGKVLKVLDKGERLGDNASVMRWSPDGKYASYFLPAGGEDEEETMNLVLVEVETGIRGEVEGVMPFHAWSPDSTCVAAVTGKVGDMEESFGEVVVYDVGEDNAETVAHVALTEMSVFDGIGWSAGGEAVIFGALDITLPVEAVSDEATAGIYSVGRDGTGLRKLADCGAGIAYVRVSPDGKRMIYAVWATDEEGNDRLELWVAGTDGANAVRVTADAEPEFPIWVGNGKVAFAESVEGEEGASTMRLMVAEPGKEGVDIRRKAVVEGEAEEAEPAAEGAVEEKGAEPVTEEAGRG